MMQHYDTGAVLILGMIGIAHPEDIAPRTARIVTQVLLGHLFEGGTVFATVAAEIVGKGFSLWRPHIQDMPQFLRHLVHTIDAAGKRTAASRRGKSSTLAAAKHALLEAASTEPLVFMATIGSEVLRQDRGPQYHKVCLGTVVSLVKEVPLLMVRHLPIVIEAVIRPLYPGEPALRKLCLDASTRALHALVRRFPMVAFHQQTQRLACGTISGKIIIYDLRTATKWRILEGAGVHSISVVTFAADGNMLASYCAEDGHLSTWTAGSSGFLGGILGMQGRHKQRIDLGLTSPEHLTLDNIVQRCRLQFSSSNRNQIKLRREDGQVCSVGLR